MIKWKILRDGAYSGLSTWILLAITIKSRGHFGGDTQREGDEKTNLRDANTSQEKPTAARTWKRQCINHSVMSLSQSPWTIAHQALLSMEFSRQEYWIWLPLSSRVSAKTVTQLTPWFRTCDHKKCERIDSCSFKPPNMWPFVRPASGNKYK